MRRPLVVVMGVSGTGKSTVGRALAQRCGLEFADGDDFHPPENIAAMAAGRALTDEDRRPWLVRVGEWLAAHEESGGVIGCSALRRAYRDLLRDHAPRTTFLHLVGDRDLIAGRMDRREGHFMPAAMLASQLATLEPLDADEAGTTADVATSVTEIVESARRLFEC